MSTLKLSKSLTQRKSAMNLIAGSASKSDMSKDLHFKLSKKIAQLTKVIYYLNTKNEDTGQRIKFITDAYETELKDTIRDGEGVIQELQIKLAEVEEKNKHYLNSLKQKDQLLQQQEAKLTEAKERQAKLEEQAKEKIRAAKSMLKDHANNSLQLSQEHLEETEEMRKSHATELEELKENHTFQLQEMRDQHYYAVQELTEKFRKDEDLYKDTIAALQSQLEKEVTRRQTDMVAQRRQFEEREELLKQQFETVTTQMRLNLEEETRRVDQKNNQIVELSDQIDNKNILISTLEADRWELEQKLKVLQDKFDDLSNNYHLLNTEHKYLEELVKQYEYKIPKIEDELSSTKTMLENYKSMYGEAVEKVNNLTVLSNRLEVQLKDLQEKYNTALAEIATLKDELSVLSKLKEEHELQITQLSNTIVENQSKYETEIQDKLLEQKETMERERETEVLTRIAVLAADKDDLLAQRLEEISKLNQDIQNLKDQHQEEIQCMINATESLKVEHQGYIDALNEIIEQKKKHIQKLGETIDDKEKVIFGHLGTIQTREATIKSLEVDMADLFQKMVQCDKQIRSEMTEKYTKERHDLEAEWTIRHNMDMEALKVTLEREHREKNTKQSQDLKNQFQEELDLVHSNYRIKIEGIMQEMGDKETGILNLRKEITQMEQKIKELGYQFEEKEAKMIEDFQAQLDAARSEWDRIMAEKEKEASENHQAAVSALEQKHSTIQFELTASHKKQLDDLRNFYTMSMSNAKKEHEAQRQQELLAQKSVHDSFVISLTTKHESFIISERNRLHDEKEKEIADITEDFDNQMAELRRSYDALLSEKNELSQIKEDLEGKLLEAQGQLQLNIVQLEQNEKELERKLKEFESTIAQNRIDYDNSLKSEKEQIQVIHIQEMQALIQEFERAKNYLKKEIAQLQKQYLCLIRLEDAAEKYINREPRLIDVQMIDQLTKKNESLQKQVQEMTNELHNYRLEMNNREVAFNKIFNNTPLVGIIHPNQKAKSPPKKKNSNPRLPPLQMDQY